MDPITSPAENGVNQTDFLKLFMQELTYQDPLKPVDNREFMAQMAQLSVLQETRITNERLGYLMGISTANQSLLLLNKQVTIKGSGETGQVKAITFNDQRVPQLKVALKGSEQTFNVIDIMRVSE